ncbi:MAG: hypothetical protein ACP5IB_10385, partial [Thermoplasmata archaeon]
MIFIYNWRSSKHKRSGGSEKYIYEIMKEIKDKIIFFTSYDGKERIEKNGNIITIKVGIDYFPLLITLFSLKFLFKYKPKLVIENINHIPFFVPWKNKIAIVHHFSGKQALYQFPLFS